MICVHCHAELVETFWGPITEFGYVCRFIEDPTDEDQGQHVAEAAPSRV